jgi:hypothetical protein
VRGDPHKAEALDSTHVRDDVGEPTFVVEWREFLRTVEVRGPIPVVFEIVRWTRDAADEWLLRWTMSVPDRVTGTIEPVVFQNRLPDAGTTALKRAVVRQCVLGAFQHEALESIFIGGDRTFDPHGERWYSNLVADWRFVP